MLSNPADRLNECGLLFDECWASWGGFRRPIRIDPGLSLFCQSAWLLAEASGGVLVVGEGFGDRMLADGGQDWVGDLVDVLCDETETQTTDASSCPGRGV